MKRKKIFNYFFINEKGSPTFETVLIVLILVIGSIGILKVIADNISGVIGVNQSDVDNRIENSGGAIDGDVIQIIPGESGGGSLLALKGSGPVVSNNGTVAVSAFVSLNEFNTLDGINPAKTIEERLQNIEAITNASLDLSNYTTKVDHNSLSTKVDNHYQELKDLIGNVKESSVKVDSSLNATSSNAIANKVVYDALSKKEASLSNGALSNVAHTNLASNVVLISNANGKVSASSITTTELNALSGATSSLQQQINELKNRPDTSAELIKEAVKTEITNIQMERYGLATNTRDGLLSSADYAMIHDDHAAIGNLSANIITQTITEGDTTHAPSADAVFKFIAGIVATLSGAAATSSISLAHNHDALYSKLSHNHDSVYSKLTHNHDSVYSKTSHSHDTVYSKTSHNHDSVYSKTDHNHDTRYVRIFTTKDATAKIGDMAIVGNVVYFKRSATEWEGMNTYQ